MPLQLYMATSTRQLILSRHDFYVAQIACRVLSQFNDMQREANIYGDREFSWLRTILDDGTREEADVAELAEYRAQEFYGLLSDLRQQTLFGALAGLYHQWEKELREFVEWQLVHYIKRRDAVEFAWKKSLVNVFDQLEAFGWNCRAEDFFPDIQACGLIVNVYKHGKGRSLDQLADQYSEFLAPPVTTWMPGFAKIQLDHDWVKLTDDQFNRISAALRAFWVTFPERLYLTAK